MSTRSVGATHSLRMDSGLSSPELHKRPTHARRLIRQDSGRSAVTSSSSGSDDSVLRTPVSPQTRHSHSWFAPPLQTTSMASHTPHTPFTQPPFRAPRLAQSASHSTYPDSRPLVYNPQIPHLHPAPPQEHRSTFSSTATHTAFVDDREGMPPLSVLDFHTTAYPDERVQGLEVTLEEMPMDGAAVDNITQSQSQPPLESPGGLLSVMNSNGPESIQRPASAPPIFPHSGVESGRHEGGAIVDDIDDLYDDQVGCYLPTIPAMSGPPSQLASATPDREQDQTRILADLAKMHNFTPRPELRPFPDSHPYLYYLFPPPPTAQLITQAIVHPSLVSVIPISRTNNPEITGTRGRRTAANDRGGMRVGEVRGPMYENVPLIDVLTGVVHYPGAGHTSVMTGGVRISSCSEEEEVMELLEMMEIVEREEEMNKAQTEDAWWSGTPISEQPIPHFPSTPVEPVHPRLFDYHHHHHHIHNGYAYTSPPSSPVYARRPTLAQFEYPQVSQQPTGMVQPLQPPIQLTSPVQHRRPSSHLANEYLPHQRQQQGTGTTEDLTPKTRRVYGYHPGFPSSFSPAVCAVSTPVPQSPAPYMAPALATPGYAPANHYTPQPSPGPYAWYGVSTIGNAYTPTPDANTNSNAHGYFRPPSVAAPAPPIQAAVDPSLGLALPATVPDSRNTPQVFYTDRELEAHFLKDAEPVYSAPARPKRGVKRAVGKQATLGVDGTICHSGEFGTSEPLEEPHPHPYPDPVPAMTGAGIERPASVPPILDEDDDMMTVEVSTEASTRANRKRKRDQVRWDYREEIGGGGDGGEGASDDEVVLSADERKRARIGHGGSTRRRSFGDDKRPPGSVTRTRLAY